MTFEEMAGIDLGTANLKMAGLDPLGNPVVVTAPSGQTTIPAAIFLNGDDVIIGQEALNARFQDPDRCMLDWKRYMGTDEVLAVSAGGTDWRARDCARALIGHLKENFEQKTGRTLGYVAIGIPPTYDQRQREETKQAAEACSLEVLCLVHEPTAAALGNGVHQRGDGLYKIPDVGGGTTDDSLVRVSGNTVEVVGTRGSQTVAGRDFTLRLAAHGLDCFEKEHGFRPTPTDHPLTFVELSQHAEQLKHTLSERASGTLVVSCNGQFTTVTVTREQFTDMCQDLLEQIWDCAIQLLADCQVQPTELKEVLAVGGGSMMPAFREGLADRLGVPLSVHCEPHLAVARGCTLAGRMELERQGRPVVVDGVVLPPINWFLREVTSHDIGVTALADNGQRQINAVVLPRHTPVPCDRTRQFRLAEPNQTNVRIELLQGEADADRSACHVLGFFDLDGLTAVANGPHPVEVRLRIDRNGILTAAAYDPATGQSAELVVDYQGLSSAA